MLRGFVMGAVLVGATVFAVSANASALDELKSAIPGGSGASGVAGALGGDSLLGQLGGGGFSLASPQNVLGVLSFCQAHGYAPSATETVKDKLMSKFGMGGQAEQSSDYKEGATGLLKDAQGGTLDLTKLKDIAGRKACGMVADKATSSLLGGL